MSSGDNARRTRGRTDSDRPDADSAVRGPAARRSKVRFGKGSKAMRRVSGSLALFLALLTVGFAYAALAPSPQIAQAAEVDQQQIAAGEALYNNSCITCHGANLQGVKDRGPSLVGVGQAATYFQVGTGRMPAVENAAQMPRKKPVFNEEEIAQLSAYIQSVGGGPQVPTLLRDDAEVAKGGELYRLNCASCHNFTGGGGALSQGKYAPPLDEATDAEVYSAMLSGPENMPKFSDAQLTPAEKQAIVSFVQLNKATIDPGGLPLGGYGPAPEGLIAFLVGMVSIVGVTLWMGARA